MEAKVDYQCVTKLLLVIHGQINYFTAWVDPANWTNLPICLLKESNEINFEVQLIETLFACATLHQEEGIMFIYLGNKAPSTAINSFNYKWSWCTSILWKFNSFLLLLHRYENWVNLELKPFWWLCWMKPDIQPLIGCTLREHAAGFHFFLLI